MVQVQSRFDAITPMLVITVRTPEGRHCPARASHTCPWGAPELGARDVAEVRASAGRYAAESCYPDTAFDAVEARVEAKSEVDTTPKARALDGAGAEAALERVRGARAGDDMAPLAAPFGRTPPA